MRRGRRATAPSSISLSPRSAKMRQVAGRPDVLEVVVAGASGCRDDQRPGGPGPRPPRRSHRRASPDGRRPAPGSRRRTRRRRSPARSHRSRPAAGAGLDRASKSSQTVTGSSPDCQTPSSRNTTTATLSSPRRSSSPHSARCRIVTDDRGSNGIALADRGSVLGRDPPSPAPPGVPGADHRQRPGPPARLAPPGTVPVGVRLQVLVAAVRAVERDGSLRHWTSASSARRTQVANRSPSARSAR